MSYHILNNIINLKLQNSIFFMVKTIIKGKKLTILFWIRAFWVGRLYIFIDSAKDYLPFLCPFLTARNCWPCLVQLQTRLFHPASHFFLIAFKCFVIHILLFAVVFIGSTLFALQQLSGINAIFYFSSTVFKSVGVPSNLTNIFIGISNLTGMSLLSRKLSL